MIGSANGNFAILEDFVIVEFTTDEQRKNLCRKNHGKRYRVNKDFNVLENWMKDRTNVRYKVRHEDKVYYFKDKSLAEDTSCKYRSVVEILGYSKKTIKMTYNKSVELPEAGELDTYIRENIESIKEFTENLYITKETLKKKLSTVDKKIVDIEHAMEFSKLDAASGYKMYKLAHECFNERREIKNNLRKVDILISSQLGESIQYLDSRLDDYERTYTPRVLKELFI